MPTRSLNSSVWPLKRSGHDHLPLVRRVCPDYNLGSNRLPRSKPEYTSYTTHFPMLHLHCNDSTVAATTIIRHHQQQHTGCHSNGNGNGTGNSSSNGSNNTCPALSQTRRHTIISTTLTNYNQQLAAAATLPGTQRRASIGWDTSNSTSNSSNSISTENPTIPHHPNAYKPVRITLIGDPQLPQPNGVKMRYTTNGCQSVKVKSNSNGHGPSPHYQPLYNSNKMTNPTVTIV